MVYYKVPFINGILDIDYTTMRSGIHIQNTNEAIVMLDDNVVVRNSWTSATQTDWDNASAPTLDQVKTSKIAELDQAFQAAFTTFQSPATGVTKTYPINQEAQDNLKDLQQRLIADPNKSTFYFLTIDDGILIAHTRAQFLQLLQDAENREVSLHNQNRTYANQIKAATDKSTAQAMTFTFS